MTKKEKDPDAAAGPSAMLGFLINQFGDRIAKETTLKLKPFGITPRDLGILLSLEGDAPRSQLDLGRMLRLDRTTIGQMIDRLEQKGWLIRIARAEDRRHNTLKLTTDGRARLRKAKQAANEVEERLVACLAPVKAEALKASLRKCLASLEADGSHDLEVRGERRKHPAKSAAA